MNGQQPSLFDPKPAARRRDPETSHIAATKAESFAVSHRNRIMAVIDPDGTIKEIAARCGLDHVAVARRMKELQDMEKAEPTTERRAGCRVWKRT